MKFRDNRESVSIDTFHQEQSGIKGKAPYSNEQAITGQIFDTSYSTLEDLLKAGNISGLDYLDSPMAPKEPQQMGADKVTLEDKDLEGDYKVEFHHGMPKRKEKKAQKNRYAALNHDGKVYDIRREIKKGPTNGPEVAAPKIGKNGTENISEMPAVLDEFDIYKQNFQEISDELVKKLKKETNAETYISVSQSLYSLCKSQNRQESYYLDETIAHRLFKAEKLSQTQLQRILTIRNNSGRSLQYTLAASNVIDENLLIQFLGQQFKGCETTTLTDIKYLPESILRIIPFKFIKKYNVLPLRADTGYLHIATMDPRNLDALNDIRFISGYTVVPYLAAEYYLQKGIERFYNLKTKNSAKGYDGMEIGSADGFEFIEAEKTEEIAADELIDNDAPVVKLVNNILKKALLKNASDIHIEPFEHELRVRFRTDGTLTTSFTPPVEYAKVISSRIKIMAGLDIAERRLPQDGRFKLRMNGNYIDFRVSVFPGIYGEKVVLRLLDKSNVLLDLNNIGFRSDALDSVLTAMYKSKGMILVTGPTGSGKTTTLYSMLHMLNDGAMNISTAEDPIEYNFEGINQFQMNSKIGLGFARALRTLLRQDPDIIMVGEIRDLETAETAVRAALTGHLVMSTLHTNNAPETITRLIDMGIEPYLITSSVNLVIAQRLMRKICERCKIEASPSDLQLKILATHGLEIKNHKVYMGKGCKECNNTGYNGRFAIHEVMPIWDEIQEDILKSKSSFEMRTKAHKLGLVTLQEQGFTKVVEGKTSLDEWMRVVA